jgi:hypothetical protein
MATTLSTHSFPAGACQWLIAARWSAGCLPMERLGMVNGLSSKGVLTAPWIARQWVNHLAEGIAFDPDIAIERCWRAGRSAK